MIRLPQAPARLIHAVLDFSCRIYNLYAAEGGRGPMIRLHLTRIGGVGAALWVLGSPAAEADGRGTAILREAFGKLGAAKTMECKLMVTASDPRTEKPLQMKGTVAAMKPNFLRVEVTDGHN